MKNNENLQELFEKNEAFCVLPWIHIYGSVDGVWGRCCMDNTVFYDQDYKHHDASEILLDKNSLGCINSSEFSRKEGNKIKGLKEIFNSPDLRETRKSMLEGKKIKPCTACYEIDSKGGESYRKRMNNLFRSWEKVNWNSLIKATNSEGYLTAEPIYFDVRFGNHCNLRCVMCNFPTSSKWGKSEKETTEKPQIIDPYFDNSEFWTDLEEMINNISRVYFAGGEPFLQKGHIKLLNLLIQKKLAKDIKLVYSTNLTFFPVNFINKLKQFKNVELGVSCDGTQPVFESIRIGAKWKQFYQNLAIAKKHFPITLLFTTQQANIFNLIEFIEWAINESLLIDLSNILIYPENMSISKLNNSDKVQILAQLENYYSKIVIGNANEYAKQLRVVINFLTSECNVK